MNKNKSLRIVALQLEGGKVQGYEMSGTRGRQLFEETKLSKLPISAAALESLLHFKAFMSGVSFYTGLCQFLSPS